MFGGGEKIIIQAILVIAMTILGTFMMRTQGARNQALRRLGLFFFTVGSIISIFYPRIFSRLANWVGVGRGTDLLLYLLLIAFLASVANQYRRSVEHDRRLTKLARQLALSNAPDMHCLHGASPTSASPTTASETDAPQPPSAATPSRQSNPPMSPPAEKIGEKEL